MSRFAVTSWNIEFALRVSQAIDIMSASAEIVSSDALCLQEMDEPGTVRIAEALGWNYRYAPSAVHRQTNRPVGNAILSPHELGEEVVVELPGRSWLGGTRRAAIGTLVAAPDGPVAVWSTHIEIPTMGPGARRAQVEAAARAAESGLAAERTVIAGDFNTVSRWDAASFRAVMAAAGLSEMTAEPLVTLRRFGYNMHLDRIFARGLSPTSVQVIDAQGASDHHAVWAELATG